MARYNRLQGGAPDRTQNSTQDGLDALERSDLKQEGPVNPKQLFSAIRKNYYTAYPGAAQATLGPAVWSTWGALAWILPGESLEAGLGFANNF